MFIDQISVFLANQTGRLADVTDVLAAEKVDIRAMSLAETEEYGVLRMIVDDPTRAVEKLRQAGVAVRVTPVIAARFDDEPGAMAKVLKTLNDACISVTYAYAFISPVCGGAAAVLRTNDCGRAAAVLTEKGIELMKAEDIHK